MFQLIPKTNFDFVGKRYVCFAISACLLLAGMASLVMKKGPRWGLDFTGGSLVEVKFESAPSVEEIRKVLSDSTLPSFEIQSVSGHGIIVRTQEKATEDAGKKIQAALMQSFAGRNPVILRKEFVGPTVGRHLFKQTALAFILTFIGIIIYVGFRFNSPIWGAAGVVAGRPNRRVVGGVSSTPAASSRRSRCWRSSANSSAWLYASVGIAANAFSRRWSSATWAWAAAKTAHSGTGSAASTTSSVGFWENPKPTSAIPHGAMP